MDVTFCVKIISNYLFFVKLFWKDDYGLELAIMSTCRGKRKMIFQSSNGKKISILVSASLTVLENQTKVIRLNFFSKYLKTSIMSDIRRNLDLENWKWAKITCKTDTNEKIMFLYEICIYVKQTIYHCQDVTNLASLE